MDIVEYVQNCFKLYLFDESAYKYIDKKVDWVTGYVVVLILSLLIAAINSLVNSILSVELLIVAMIIGILIAMVIGILTFSIGIFLGYGVLHLLFKFFGGKASFENFVKFGLSLTVFPSFFSLLLVFIPEQLYEENIIALATFVLLNLVLAIWAIVAGVKTYSKLQELSLGKTFLVLMIPLIFLVLLALLIGVLVGFAYIA